MNLYHVTTFDTLFPFTCLSNVNDLYKNTGSFTLVVSIRIFWGVIIRWFSSLRNSQLEYNVCRKRDVKSRYCFFLYSNNLRQHDRTTRLLTYFFVLTGIPFTFWTKVRILSTVVWKVSRNRRQVNRLKYGISQDTGNSWRFFLQHGNRSHYEPVNDSFLKVLLSRRTALEFSRFIT